MLQEVKETLDVRYATSGTPATQKPATRAGFFTSIRGRTTRTERSTLPPIPDKTKCVPSVNKASRVQVATLCLTAQLPRTTVEANLVGPPGVEPGTNEL